MSFFFLLFSFNQVVLAHSGGKDSFGCHNCNVGSCAGTYHCHNGGSGGGSDWSPLEPIRTIPSETRGGPTYFINKNGGVDMLFDWERPDGKKYSIVLSKTAGGDPGPNPDTNRSEYTFTNIIPGRWHVNIKEEFDGYWSRVTYWTIDVPTNVKDIAKPYPTPTPIPTKQISPTNRETSIDDSSNSLQTIAMVGLGAGIYHFFNKVKK